MEEWKFTSPTDLSRLQGFNHSKCPFELTRLSLSTIAILNALVGKVYKNLLRYSTILINIDFGVWDVTTKSNQIAASAVELDSSVEDTHLLRRSSALKNLCNGKVLHPASDSADTKILCFQATSVTYSSLRKLQKFLTNA
jgi:hypothetical protein